MNDVRKTELLEVGKELSLIFDRLGRTKMAINYEILHTPKHSPEALDNEKGVKATLGAQDHVMEAIFELSKVTG